MALAASLDSALLAMCAAEARAHLGRIEAGVAALGQSGDGAVFDDILDTLHTLAGAARSVELLELEWLCRALELVFGGARDRGAASVPREAIAAALALAPHLIGQPSGRNRNQALVLCRQLDALAVQLAQPTTQ